VDRTDGRVKEGYIMSTKRSVVSPQEALTYARKEGIRLVRQAEAAIADMLSLTKLLREVIREGESHNIFSQAQIDRLTKAIARCRKRGQRRATA
jgi:hypothetical protein